MLIIDILMGMAREDRAFIKRFKTFDSLPLEHIEINALLTSSEMKEFVSSVFLSNFVKIESSSVSRPFFILLDKSFKVITAFLLRFDLRLSTSLIT